jgi:hypothetical protein
VFTLEMRGGGAVMWKKIWQFFQDELNLRLLTLIGGGLAIVIGGLWAAFVYFFPPSEHKSSPPQKQVEAECGSVNARIFCSSAEFGRTALPFNRGGPAPKLL